MDKYGLGPGLGVETTSLLHSTGGPRILHGTTFPGHATVSKCRLCPPVYRYTTMHGRGRRRQQSQRESISSVHRYPSNQHIILLTLACLVLCAVHTSTYSRCGAPTLPNGYCTNTVASSSMKMQGSSRGRCTVRSPVTTSRHGCVRDDDVTRVRSSCARAHSGSAHALHACLPRRSASVRPHVTYVRALEEWKTW
jgi:hypothetical protein